MQACFQTPSSGKRAKMRKSMRLFLTAMVAALVTLPACENSTNDNGDAEPQETVAPTAGSPSPRETSVDMATCKNPEGFSISYPGEWHVNSGDVVPACAQFNPEPFEVPEGTDERVAAITAFVDPVPFERISAPDERRDADRQEMAISGHPAVRLEYGAGRNSIWPDGTPITTYMIDFPANDKGRQRTLLIDTVGLEAFDYERNQEVLDRMADTIQITSSPD